MNQPTPEPTINDAQRRALEQAEGRTWRILWWMVAAFLIVPFVIFRAFHPSDMLMTVLRVVLLCVAVRSAVHWWTIKRTLIHLRQRRSAAATPRRKGSYPSAHVRRWDTDLADAKACAEQGLIVGPMSGVFNDQPLYEGVWLDNVWYTFEAIDELDEVVLDTTHRVVVLAGRYRQSPDTDPRQPMNMVTPATEHKT